MFRFLKWIYDDGNPPEIVPLALVLCILAIISGFVVLFDPIIRLITPEFFAVCLVLTGIIGIVLIWNYYAKKVNK